jgi:4-carboxymuconolactone decarboxylase
MDSHGLGGRVPLLNPEELTAAQKSTYESMDRTMVPWADSSGFVAKLADGKLVGPFNGFLLSPEITASFLQLQEAEQKHTTLTERIRQTVILTVGAVWQSNYERYAHSAVALKAGIPGGAIRALVAGEPAAELGDKERLAQRFTWKLTTERQVDDDLYAEAVAGFGAQGIVDIIYLAGCYDTISSLLNTFRVPVPE